MVLKLSTGPVAVTAFNIYTAVVGCNTAIDIRLSESKG